MNLGKIAPLIAVAILLLAARFAVNIPQVDQKVEREKATQRQADEKARRLASACTYLLTDADYAVMFPDKPRQDQFILIGSNENDWHLHWSYDTSFEIERSEVADGRGPQSMEADRILLRNDAKQMVERKNQFMAGKPDAWVVQNERDLTVLDMFAAREFTYAYKKYTTQLPRTGRACKIKVPGAIITLLVDGEPEVVSSPLVESFFASFSYLPPPN